MDLLRAACAVVAYGMFSLAILGKFVTFANGERHSGERLLIVSAGLVGAALVRWKATDPWKSGVLLGIGIGLWIDSLSDWLVSG